SESEILLNRLPDEWRSSGNPVALTFAEAWHRTKLRLKDLGKLAKDDGDVQAQTKPDFQVKRRGREPLEIFSPVQNQIIHQVLLPTQVRIQWHGTAVENDS